MLLNCSLVRPTSLNSEPLGDRSLEVSDGGLFAQLLSATVIRRSPDSAPRYTAFGDASGKLYLFSPAGVLAAEHGVGTCLCTQIDFDEILQI